MNHDKFYEMDRIFISFQDYLFATLKSGIPDLCFDLYGCRVIQCILINGTHYHRSQIFNTIRNSDIELLNMIQDRYGNYVIQHAIRMYIEFAFSQLFCHCCILTNSVFFLCQNTVH